MRHYILTLLVFFTFGSLKSQYSTTYSPENDSITDLSVQEFDFSKRKKVFWTAGISSYVAMGTGLYFAWYDNYPQSGFHTFNDWNEWRNMDKAGHAYSAYFQSSLIHDLSQWAGYSDEKAMMISSLSSIAGQLTIEVMDGFSRDWGFSVSDMASNLVGTGLFYIQEKKWKEQRIKMKMSYWPESYSEESFSSESGLFSTTQKERSKALFGSSGIERFLKDYNGQTIWLSANLRAFMPDSRIPKFLNLALGYSARNLYGGFANSWDLSGDTFVVDESQFPRSSQWILGLDINLESIYHSTEFGKALFKVLDIFKFPAPAVSYDTQDGFQFHLLFLN